MSRLPPASRDQVPADQVDIFDQMVKKYGLSSHATASILVRVPKLWRIERDLGDYLVRGCSLTKDVVELVFLVVAVELDCQFMWDWHAGSATKAGLPDGIVEALRDGTELPPLSDKHMAVIHYGRETYRNHHVSYGTFSLVRETLGERGVVELGLLYGRLLMHALLLNGTDADLEPERKVPVLPIY